MLKCDPFGLEPPGSGLPGAQPFRVTVDPLVLAVVDFHSHLLSSEIIGFLGGHWDAEQRLLHLREAFPCRSIAGDTGSVHVELDPLAEVQVRAAIEGRQMQVVGWYHSHPVFAPQPSIRDVQNQQNYQTLFHDQAFNMFPFVGLIVSPYDGRLSSAASALTMFYVESSTSSAGGNPKRCTYEAHSLPPSPGSEAPTSMPTPPWPPSRTPSPTSLAADDPMRRYWDERLRTTGRTLCALVHYYRKHRQRTALHAPWKRKQKAGQSQTGPPPYTKLDKLIKSVRSRVVDAFGEQAVDPLLSAVVEYIDANWVAPASKGAS